MTMFTNDGGRIQLQEYDQRNIMQIEKLLV